MHSRNVRRRFATGLAWGAISIALPLRAEDVPPAPDTTSVPEHEVPPADETTAPAAPASGQEIEGGVGLGIVSEVWSSALGMGPRLDVSIGPPGPFAFLLGEDILFGVGSASSSQMTMFDVQAGITYGAPFKVPTGFGAAVLLGAQRMSASFSGSDVSSLWSWAATADLGLRGSLRVGPTHVWLGADLLLRSEGLDVGGPYAIDIPKTSYVFTAGCFFPAIARGADPMLR